MKGACAGPVSAGLNIRISSRDLKNLQARALEEGIPYQTFAASLSAGVFNGF